MWDEFACCCLQEVELLRMERLQIDEQLKLIGMGQRPSSGHPADKDKSYTTDDSVAATSVNTSRSYTGRGRRGPNYTSGYGERHVHNDTEHTFCRFSQDIFQHLSAGV